MQRGMNLAAAAGLKMYRKKMEKNTKEEKEQERCLRHRSCFVVFVRCLICKKLKKKNTSANRLAFFYRSIQLNAELRNFVLSLHLERDNLLLCRCEMSEDWLQALIIWFFRNASNRVI